MRFILAIILVILARSFRELESFLGLRQEHCGDLPEAGAGFVGANYAFEADEGDDVMLAAEHGDDGVL